MKITNEDRQLFSEIVKKHKLKREGFLMNIFKRKLSKQLAKDKDLQKALIDGDKQIDDLKKVVKDMQDKGYKIPSYAQRYLQ